MNKTSETLKGLNISSVLLKHESFLVNICRIDLQSRDEK